VVDAGARAELVALRLSFALTTLFTTAAFAIALVADSETMTLEALSGLVDVVVSLLAMFVARKVHEPANARYHFGYAKYEPLMIAVEGTLLAAVCLSAISDSVRDLVHPEPVGDSGLVIAYAAASFVVSVGLGTYMRRLGRRAGSPLVVADAQLWTVEGWLSLGVCAAFVAAVLLSPTSGVQYTAYFDPVVCIVLSLVLLRKPAELLKESLLDLVDANPYSETVNAVEQLARECVGRYGLSGLASVRLRKAGRRIYALVTFFEAPQQSLEAMERVRKAVTEEMARLDPDVDVSVLFLSGR
jgi:cation diffusion facilitator family transporter